MKTLLTLLLLLAVTANAQFRRESDKKIYPYASTPQSNDVFIIGRPGVTNYNLPQSNALAYIYGVNTNNTTLIASNQAWMATNGYAPTVTNITYYIVTNNLNGNLITNINGQNVRYQTNLGNATYIDVGNKYTGFATNNNISIAGCANLDSTGTNVSWGILTITNLAGSGAVKTITIPTAWVDVDNLGGTTIHNTNQGILSVMVYPGLGTNFIWRGK